MWMIGCDNESAVDCRSVNMYVDKAKRIVDDVAI